MRRWKITPFGEEVLLLAHNYVRAGIQDAADLVGDSLELAKYAREVKNGVIVIAGVDFMAEMAAILSPSCDVIHPEPFAQCAMASRLTPDMLNQAKTAYPGVPVVTYVNSSARIKACSDICCTSANAEKVVESLGVDTVIFAPDQNLGRYVERKTGVRVIPVPKLGCCPVHHAISVPDVLKQKKKYPDAVFLAHPETTAEVQALAEYTGSTSGMVRHVQEHEFSTVIVGTEPGILHRMRRISPTTRFVMASPVATCPDMKMITLYKVRQAIRDRGPLVTVDPAVAQGAKRALERMMALP